MDAKLIKTDNTYVLSVNQYYDQVYALADLQKAKELDKQKLSISNCQAVEYNLDLDELFKKYIDSIVDYVHPSFCNRADFKAGCNTIIKLLGDKRFNKEDIISAIVYHTYLEHNDGLPDTGDSDDARIDKVIQTLQQTEWDVEIVEEGDINQCDGCKAGHELTDLGMHVYPESTRAYMVCQANKYKKPKLDADGCLILKRK